MPALPRCTFMKVAATAKAAGSLHSLWAVAGYPGAGGTPPTGSGEAPDNTEAGAMALSDAGFLDAPAAAGAVAGGLIIYDRLVHTSGLDGTVATAQTVNTTAITRPNANGEGVEIWIEIYTPTGTTPRTITASYTNELGVSGRTTPAVSLPASPVAGQLFVLPLQAGDRGVRSVQTVTLSGSTGTAGDFGVTLVRRLGLMPLIVADIPVLGAVGDRAQVYATSCLALAVLPSSTDTGLIIGEIGLS